RGGAPLAGGAERRPDDALDREVDVCVIEDDDRVLPAELSGDAFEQTSGDLADVRARVARTGERDEVDAGMLHEVITDLAARAELTSTVACDVVGHVDALLNIAAGFGEDLPHLARHLAREVVLALEHDLAGPIEDLAALWGGVEAPRIRGALCGLDGLVDVGRRGLRRGGDDLAGRGIEIFEGLAGCGVDPAAVDVVLQMCCRHVTPLTRQPARLARATSPRN